jgi:hypothetical protein
MGKSDPIVFREYSTILPRHRFDAVAFLGYRNENAFTTVIKSKIRHFYDINPDKSSDFESFVWNINEGFQPNRKYDLIVATRCPYFSKNPAAFVEDCMNSLNPGGMLLCDWGLGDHWRFKSYKVGWVRDGEHEWAYEQNNLLHSCLWNKEIANNDETIAFWKYAKKAGAYDDTKTLESVINEEVPALCDYDYDFLRVLMMWPEAPQLYLITVTIKK